jgi:hypothetical protein
MSKRKRVLLWAGFLVVLAMAGLLGMRLATAREPEIYRRIQVGMSRDEVYQLFGRKPYSVEIQGHEEANVGWDFPEGSPYADEIVVYFDTADKVREKMFVSHTSDSFFTRLRRWLGL